MTTENDKLSIAVRLARQADAIMLRDNCFTANKLEQVSERVSGYLSDSACGDCVPLVAEVGGVVVGFAAIRRDHHSLRRHRATLIDMVVSGEYQRRGIARRLITVLYKHAAKMGVEILETSVRGSTTAEEVYHKVGFREYGRLAGGLVEPWGARQVFDEVYLAMPVQRH